MIPVESPREPSEKCLANNVFSPDLKYPHSGDRGPSRAKEPYRSGQRKYSQKRLLMVKDFQTVSLKWARLDGSRANGSNDPKEKVRSTFNPIKIRFQRNIFSVRPRSWFPLSGGQSLRSGRDDSPQPSSVRPLKICFRGLQSPLRAIDLVAAP